MRVFVHLSTAEYHETAPPLLGLGGEFDIGPAAVLLLAIRTAAPLQVGLAHIDQDYAVPDLAHGRVCRGPASNLGYQSFFLSCMQKTVGIRVAVG